MTASFDKTARIWPVLPQGQALIDYAKQKLPRCLTNEQRDAYALDPSIPDWCYAMSKWPFKPRRFGISGNDLPDILVKKLGLENSKGMIVTRIHAGLAAEAAGLKVDDVVLSLDGAPVEGREAVREKLEGSPPNVPVKATVLRKGERKDIVMQPRD